MPRVLGLGGLVSTFWSRVLLPGKLEAGGGPGGGAEGGGEGWRLLRACYKTHESLHSDTVQPRSPGQGRRKGLRQPFYPE